MVVGGLTAAYYIAHACKQGFFLCAPGATGLHIPSATRLIACSQAPLSGSLSLRAIQAPTCLSTVETQSYGSSRFSHTLHAQCTRFPLLYSLRWLNAASLLSCSWWYSHALICFLAECLALWPPPENYITANFKAELYSCIILLWQGQGSIMVH